MTESIPIGVGLHKKHQVLTIARVTGRSVFEVVGGPRALGAGR